MLRWTRKLSSIRGPRSDRRHYCVTMLDIDLLHWPLTLSFYLCRQAMVMTRTRIKTKVQRSVSSKDTVKTNGRIDEETDATRDCCKILPFAWCRASREFGSDSGATCLLEGLAQILVDLYVRNEIKIVKNREFSSTISIDSNLRCQYADGPDYKPTFVWPVGLHALDDTGFQFNFCPWS